MKEGYGLVNEKIFDSILLNLEPDEIKIFIKTKQCFTNTHKEVFLKSDNVVRKLVSLDVLRECCENTYKLNPYIYIPYHADGFLLQIEWDSLTNGLPS